MISLSQTKQLNQFKVANSTKPWIRLLKMDRNLSYNTNLHGKTIHIHIEQAPKPTQSN